MSATRIPFLHDRRLPPKLIKALNDVRIFSMKAGKRMAAPRLIAADGRRHSAQKKRAPIGVLPLL
jgi:hypothetical protein